MTYSIPSIIPVIIPSYQPDQRLLQLLSELAPAAPGPVILVDDGSGPAYRDIFDRAACIIQPYDGRLLTHAKNCGKGRALKTAFSYLSQNYSKILGAVTADSDGQHSPACIRKVAAELESHPDSLILGVRTFDEKNVPWKSRTGNRLTSSVLKYLTGLDVGDTQTGLRGIPLSFMKELLSVRGERFEFEMRMLLESADHYPIRQVPIATIYDSRDHHQTHFHPVWDSIRIYRILGERFFKYIFSSLSSAALDLGLFAAFSVLFLKILPASVYILAATVAARILSAAYNYAVNYKLVFHSREKGTKAAGKYFLLAVVQMACSAVIVNGFTLMFPAISAVTIKAVTDTILFFLSYSIQRKLVFAGRGAKVPGTLAPAAGGKVTGRWQSDRHFATMAESD
ncbi:MAG: bifunctional glycosyltransferase family 2/GtrA family protein [Eubacterium sp.]|nr:bifunctional glycosyltransferase family 2/GtrA family protein [Eubacterium sp.]